MRILDTSQATATNVQPIKAETINFLQAAYTNALADICTSIIGVDTTTMPNQVYVMFGCQNSGTGNTFIISPGVVIYNGEIFEVYGPGGPGTSISLTLTGTNTANWIIAVANDTNNADPVTFSSGTTGKVHNIRTLSLVNAPPNSAIPAYNGSSTTFLNLNIARAIANAITTEVTNRNNAVAANNFFLYGGTLPSSLLNLQQLTNAVNAVGNSWNFGQPTINGASMPLAAPNLICWNIDNKRMDLNFNFTYNPAVAAVTIKLPGGAIIAGNKNSPFTNGNNFVDTTCYVSNLGIGRVTGNAGDNFISITSFGNPMPNVLSEISGGNIVIQIA